MGGKAVRPLGNLVTSLDHIIQEVNRPESKKFAGKLLSQLEKYQKSDDIQDLAVINDTFEEWKKSSYRDEWPEKAIDKPAARSMTYILQVAHALQAERQCLFFQDFSERHEEQKLLCGDHVHFRGHSEGPRNFNLFCLPDPFIYTDKTWHTMIHIGYLLGDTQEPT